MKMINKQCIGFGTILLALSACTSTISEGVQADGTVKGNVIFPKKETATLKGGTFPHVENINAIGAGMTRAQLFDLVGHPHFREMTGAREWDFIFNFRNADSSVKTCQYKVIFDKERLAQSFYWQPKNCAPRGAKKPVATARATKASILTDALFTFNHGGIGDIKPSGKVKLDKLAKTIIDNGNHTRLSVTGYTDRIGSDAYNLQLSQLRANAVAQYLVLKGVKTKLISTKGLGEINPVVTCNKSNRKALIACLAPNRRVEVEAW